MDNLVFTFSGAAGSGKDTCVQFVKEYLEELGLKSFSLAYADYLKVLAKRNFGYDDSRKEDYRDILQHFGTDVVRQNDDMFWIQTVFNTIDVLRNEYDVFLISDARFENELQPSPWSMGYPIFNVYVRRDFDSKLTESEQNHESEKMGRNPNFDEFHFIISNTGTLDDLKKTTKRMIDFVLNIKEHLAKEKEEISKTIEEAEQEG